MSDDEAVSNPAREQPRGGNGRWVKGVDSIERDAEALRLRSMNRALQEVSDEFGYGGPQNVIREIKAAIGRSRYRLWRSRRDRAGRLFWGLMMGGRAAGYGLGAFGEVGEVRAADAAQDGGYCFGGSGVCVVAGQVLAVHDLVPWPAVEVDDLDAPVSAA
jgi:hypothetical protein